MDLFPSDVVEKCEILEIKENVKLPNVLKKALNLFNVEGKDLLIYGSSKAIERAVALVEQVKQTQTKPVYQWNKFSEIKTKAENKLDVDLFEPIIAVVLSKKNIGDETESVQVSTESSDFKHLNDLPRLKIGTENKDNNWRQKRKIK
ncbi:unnamed protein product [Bursaphelenchus okinawaensis]|uniref:DNA/RNA-binding protein Alba-like domain-containing protein n=1 Tax=Bursaphelenchus okinawaensis TaxID=465554 RepID=A0A811L679_9BILA|nr:unnamed protein product [Bursaphelenchus okinawaensis]CAG9116654.1 unnamed protein product [Bursaphelenchus okinawaensis]